MSRTASAPGALLVIISGPSGVGKDTIIGVLRERHPDEGRHYVVTCTTRERRDGEIDGVSYHFLSPDAFATLRESDALLEAAEVHGNWYGTPREQVVDALAAGKHAILKIDVQGARAIRERVPEALTIFIVPPSIEELQGRLHERARFSRESHEDLERRKRDALSELAGQDDYDFVVPNETGKAEITARTIDEIIRAEQGRHPDRRILV